MCLGPSILSQVSLAKEPPPIQQKDGRSAPVGHAVILGHTHWFKLLEWVVLGRLVAHKLSNREQSKVGASPTLRLTRQVTIDRKTSRQHTQFCSKTWVGRVECGEVGLEIWL